MKNNALVVNSKNGFAKVKLESLQPCHKCSARNICEGFKKSNGFLHVRNPINARPGDKVQIEVPEAAYNKALIRIFGSLIAAGISGMIAGYLVSTLLSFNHPALTIIGLFAGLIPAAIWNLCSYKKKEFLYPLITDIIKKGGYNG